MMSSKNNQKRRDFLKKTALTGGAAGLAGGWVKPVVETVVLPAHAQTSANDYALSIAGNPLEEVSTGRLGDIPATADAAGPVELLFNLVPAAHASTESTEIVLRHQGGNEYSFWMLITLDSVQNDCTEYYYYKGTLTEGGSETSIARSQCYLCDPDDDCDFRDDSDDFKLVKVNAGNNAVLEINGVPGDIPFVGSAKGLKNPCDEIAELPCQTDPE